MVRYKYLTVGFTNRGEKRVLLGKKTGRLELVSPEGKIVVFYPKKAVPRPRPMSERGLSEWLKGEGRDFVRAVLKEVGSSAG